MAFRRSWTKYTLHVALLIGMGLGLLWVLGYVTQSVADSSHQQNGRAVTVQEGSNLAGGVGVKEVWNLTEVISSTTNAYDTATADVDADGELEIIVSKNGRMHFYCLKQDGTILWETPIFSESAPGYYGGEVVDLMGDGRLAYVSVSDGIWVLDALTGELIWEVTDVGDAPSEMPWILGRVTDEEAWDIILVRRVGIRYMVYVYNAHGELVWERDIGRAASGHTIAAQDIDGDGLDEIFVPFSYKTVALSHTGELLWERPLAVGTTWYAHSDFAVVTDLYQSGEYYLVHDAGGGERNPAEIEVVNAHTSELMDSFVSDGHHQWLKAADFLPEYAGQELVYVTRDAVVMRGSSLDLVWEQPLSGAHELAVGDWNGDGQIDILVSTVFRGVDRSANRDANFIVLNGQGEILYNMLYEYPPELDGTWAAAQMQTAMKAVSDYDGDGRVDVPVSFSYHDVGKFGSSRAVYQYLMSADSLAYVNEFHHMGNESTSQITGTVLKDGGLQLAYQVPSESAVVMDGVSLLLPLDEVDSAIVNDASPYTHDGYLTGGQWTLNGRFNAGLAFGNEGDVLTIPYTDTFDMPTAVVSLWLQAENIPQKRVILEKPNAFGLYLDESHQLVWYFFDSSSGRSRRIEIKASYLEAYGQFTHIVATYDGQVSRLYLNGVQQARDSHAGSIDLSGDPLFVGNEATGSLPAHAVVDDVLMLTGSAFPWTFLDDGTWVSHPIFPPNSFVAYGVLTFDHELNGGQIFYDFLDEDGQVIPDYSNITSSPVSLAGLQGIVQLRIRIQKGVGSELSPAVARLSITRAVVGVPPSEPVTVWGTWPFSYTQPFTLTSAVNDTVLFEVDAPLGWAVAISPTQVFVPAHDSTTAVVTISSHPTPISLTEPQEITITVTTQMDSVPQTVTNQILPSHRWFVPIVISSPAQ